MSSRELTHPDVILRAAREEFVRHGIRRANMSEIARRAGVSRVTVHRRFGDKAGLFRAVILADIAHFVEAFDEVWYGSEPVATRVTRAVALALEQTRAHPLLAALMSTEPETVALQFASEGSAEFELVSALIAKRLDDLVERGELAPIDTQRVAEAVNRLWYSFLVVHGGGLPGDTEEDVAAFVATVIHPLLRLSGE